MKLFEFRNGQYKDDEITLAIAGLFMDNPPTVAVPDIAAEPTTSREYAGFDLKAPKPVGVQYAIPGRLDCCIAKLPPYYGAVDAKLPPFHPYKTGPSVLVKLLL